MQHIFSTRNYSVKDFAEWEEREELELVPKFQRRDVWSAKAKSYLMDTIIRGKSNPKLYMRQDIAPRNQRTKREIVDGQQRLRTVLSFLRDGFKLSKAHNRDLGGKCYSQLDTSTQRDILKFEFSVDLLQDMPDNEIYDLFARINTYSERMKPQASGRTRAGSRTRGRRGRPGPPRRRAGFPLPVRGPRPRHGVGARIPRPR